MEVDTIRRSHDLKAIRDNSDRWRAVIFLREAGLASLAAGRTPQVFVPLVSHDEASNPALRHPFQSNQATGRFKPGHKGLKQAIIRLRALSQLADSTRQVIRQHKLSARSRTLVTLS